VQKLCIHFLHENMKKAPQKYDTYLSKIADFFSTALMAQNAQQQQEYKIHLCLYSG
jgi:hypothetical protein